MQVMIPGRGSHRHGTISITKLGKYNESSPSWYSPSESEDSSSSAEYSSKKKKRSFFKCAAQSLRKNKTKPRSDSEDLQYPKYRKSRVGSVKVGKLRGILKNSKYPERDREEERRRELETYYSSSSEDDDSTKDEVADVVPEPYPYPADRCLVGRVAQTPGARQGRGGGLALIVRKSRQAAGPQDRANFNNYRSRSMRR